MDSSVLGTGSLVLARAASTVRKLQGRMPLPPGWDHGGYTLAGGTGCMIRGARVDPRWLFLMLQSGTSRDQRRRLAAVLHLQERRHKPH